MASYDVFADELADYDNVFKALDVGDEDGRISMDEIVGVCKDSRLFEDSA